VTVHGELDRPRATQLGHVLADLIDGQGHLAVVVDLHDATATDPDRLTVLAEAAARTRLRGGAVSLTMPPAILLEVLRDRGLDHLVGASTSTRPSRSGAPW
jgi:anti-anti-sigma regulatory factor